MLTAEQRQTPSLARIYPEGGLLDKADAVYALDEDQRQDGAGHRDEGVAHHLRPLVLLGVGLV